MSVLEILNAAWAIKPAYLEMIQNIYLERREHKLGAAELREIEAAVGRPLNNNADRRYSVQDGVAIIPVMGSMVKRGGLFSNVSGMTSYDAIQRDLAQARDDSEVKAALLNIDSPGGVVSGTATTAEAIAAFGQRKSIAAWTDGMMTSAAQWLGAATGNVYIANDTTELGSIGVISRHVDVSRAQEMDGYKTTILTAGRYKGVGHPYGPLTAEHQGIMQDRLDYAYSAFINAMAEYRNAPVDKVLSSMAEGRIFTGRQAIDAGLADGMMSLDEMVAMMKEKGSRKTFSGFTASSAESHTEVTSMTREELKTDHAALFAEILEEGKAAGRAEASGETLTAERARIAAILDVPAAGHGALIKTALIEGQSAEALSLTILKAEQTQRDKHLEDSAGNANKPVPVADAPDAETETARALVAAAVQGGSIQ